MKVKKSKADTIQNNKKRISVSTYQPPPSITDVTLVNKIQHFNISKYFSLWYKKDTAMESIKTSLFLYITYTLYRNAVSHLFDPLYFSQINSIIYQPTTI